MSLKKRIKQLTAFSVKSKLRCHRQKGDGSNCVECKSQCATVVFAALSRPFGNLPATLFGTLLSPNLFRTYPEPSLRLPSEPLLEFSPNLRILHWNLLKVYSVRLPLVHFDLLVHISAQSRLGTFVSLSKKPEKWHVSNFGFWNCCTQVHSNALKHKPVRELKCLNKSG